MFCCYYGENKWNCMNISRIFKIYSRYNTADSSIKLKAPKFTRMFLVPRCTSMNPSQFPSIPNTHHAHPPLPHALPPPPDCSHAWTLPGCHEKDGISRINQGNYSPSERQQARAEWLATHLPFSVSTSGTRDFNILLYILQRKESSPPPIPSVNWALLPRFFTLILLIRGPLPPSPCKGLLLQLHQCCPLSTPSYCKAMADAAKLIISNVTQDKAAEFPPQWTLTSTPADVICKYFMKFPTFTT